MTVALCVIHVIDMWTTLLAFLYGTRMAAGWGRFSESPEEAQGTTGISTGT